MAFRVRHKTIAIAKRVVIALAFSLFLTLLGLFRDVGFKSCLLQQSFNSGPTGPGSLSVSVTVEDTFNPFLHPFDWLMGRGTCREQFSGTSQFSLGGDHANLWGRLYHAPGDAGYGGMLHDPTQRGYLPEDYYANAAIFMAGWGLLGNMILLLLAMVAIELSGKRSLYIILVAGIVGFLAGIIGTLVGLIIGIVAFLFIRFRKNALARFWNDQPKTD